MSEYVEINASKAKSISGRSGNGRPMGRAQRSYPSQQSRGEPVHSEAPPTGRKVVQFFLAKGDDDLLQTCENAWVPPSRLKTQNVENPQPSTDEAGQIEETSKKIMRILNKVSSENMHMLTDQIMALPIDTEQCLRKAIELLFQKAIDEPHFTPQYAHVCTGIHKKDNKRSGRTNPKTSFKKLLTMCCQDRLSQMHAHDEALAKSLRNIDECNDQDEKQQMRSKYVQDELNYRKRSVGNCRFMSELYKVEMLTRHILEMSLKHLLKTPKEETLECACHILNHIGNTISHKASFNKLSEYTSPECKSKIPTRIRFMMQDTIDLKENNWVPRNARPKQPISNTTYTKKPVLRVPIAQTVSTKKKGSPTEVQKVSVDQSSRLSIATKIECPKKPLLPVSVSGCTKSYASLVSPCAGRATESTISRQPSDDEIQRKCQSIVDNICPENVVPMAQSMLALPITTDACLKGIVDILFRKAMSEPELSPQYAHICSLMKNVGARSEEQKNTNTTFRIQLIAMCQNAYESMYSRKALVAKDRIDIESCKDKETRKQLQAQFDKNELDYKRSSVANCRFISELLKVNVLVPPIIEMFAEKLSETLKETPLECLYVIVKHTGNQINHSDVFERLYEYSTSGKHKLSSRVRSVIQDTLELKNSDLPPCNTTNRLLLLDQVV